MVIVINQNNRRYKMKNYVNIVKRVGFVLLLFAMSMLFGITKESLAVEAPDACESNDTFADAYPYSQVEDVEPQISHYGRAYAVGMKHANLDSENDVDWYYTNLTAGVDCIADLRNIGNRNYFIEVFYYDSISQSYYGYSSSPQYVPEFDGWPEKYIEFTAPVTGTYYIRIDHYGEWEESGNDYFFYVGPKSRTFSVVNLPTMGGVQVSGNGYSTYSSDLRYTFPSSARVISLSVTDVISNGYCSMVNKRLTTGSNNYYNVSGSNTMSNMNNVNLSKIWTIGGKCSHNGQHTPFYWSARLNGSVRVDMEPYYRLSN